MDKKLLTLLLAAILETVVEANGAPSGTMYAVVMDKLSLEDYQGLLKIAEECKLITIEDHFVKPTAQGRATVARIKAAREKAA